MDELHIANKIQKRFVGDFSFGILLRLLSLIHTSRLTENEQMHRSKRFQGEKNEAKLIDNV